MADAFFDTKTMAKKFLNDLKDQNQRKLDSGMSKREIKIESLIKMIDGAKSDIKYYRFKNYLRKKGIGKIYSKVLEWDTTVEKHPEWFISVPEEEGDAQGFPFKFKDEFYEEAAEIYGEERIPFEEEIKESLKNIDREKRILRRWERELKKYQKMTDEEYANLKTNECRLIFKQFEKEKK